MYPLLADTYNLDDNERNLLSELGIYGYEEEAGTDEWARTVAGGSRLETLDSLCSKLDADSQQLQDFAVWYRTGSCAVPLVGPPDALACPPPPQGCRRTMGIGCFPFWPVDPRCCDCIRDGAFGPSLPRVKQEMAAVKLREILRASSAEHVNVPHISQVTGSLVTLLGGTDGFVKAWHRAIEAVEDKPEQQLKQFNAISNMIKACNEMRREEESAIDQLSDDQLKAQVFRLLMERLSADQVKVILAGAADVPQSEVGRLNYG